MESRDVLKIHGALRRYCTSRVSLRSTLEVQYLLNLPCIFNTSLDSMVYLPTIITLSDKEFPEDVRYLILRENGDIRISDITSWFLCQNTLLICKEGVQKGRHLQH